MDKYIIILSPLTKYTFGDHNYEYWADFARFWNLEIKTL